MDGKMISDCFSLKYNGDIKIKYMRCLITLTSKLILTWKSLCLKVFLHTGFSEKKRNNDVNYSHFLGIFIKFHMIYSWNNMYSPHVLHKCPKAMKLIKILHGWPFFMYSVKKISHIELILLNIWVIKTVQGS